MESYEEILKTHQRDINCIIDDDRNTRFRGLSNIFKQVFSANKSINDLVQFFQLNLIKNLLRAIDDQVEKNRTAALNIIDKYFEKLKDNKVETDRDINIQIIQKLCQRINTIPFAEQSEEIRLQIVLILTNILKYRSQDFIPIVGDFSIAVARILIDQYPEVKKQAAILLDECSIHLKHYIGFHGLAIVKSLAKNLEHQHSKVRKQTIQALTNFLLCEGAGALYEHVSQSYNKMVNDKINDVRKLSYECVAELLNGFCIKNLRNFEPDLVLLLMSSLNDEVPQLIELGQKLLEECGMKRKLLALELNELN